MDKATLDELKRLEAEATPAPWHAYFTVHVDPYIVTDLRRWSFTQICKVDTSPKDYGGANNRLIAAARNAMPDLLAYISDLETESAALRTTTAEYHEELIRERRQSRLLSEECQGRKQRIAELEENLQWKNARISELECENEQLKGQVDYTATLLEQALAGEKVKPSPDEEL